MNAFIKLGVIEPLAQALYPAGDQDSHGDPAGIYPCDF